MLNKLLPKFLSELWASFWAGYKARKIHRDLDVALEALRNASNKPKTAYDYKRELMQAPFIEDVALFEGEGGSKWLDIRCVGSEERFIYCVSSEYPFKESIRANGNWQNITYGEEFRREKVMVKWSKSEKTYWVYFKKRDGITIKASDENLAEVVIKNLPKYTLPLWYEKQGFGIKKYSTLPWVAYSVITAGILAYMFLPAIAARYRPAVKEKVTQMNVKLPMQEPHYAMSVQAKGLILFTENEQLFTKEDGNKVDLSGILGQVESLKFEAPEKPNLARWQRALFVIQDISGRDVAIQSAKELEAMLSEKQIFYQSEEDRIVQPVIEAYFADASLDGPAAVESLSRQQKQILQTHLKWFGLLALAPKGTADLERRSLVMKSALKGTVQVAFMPVLYIFGLIFGSLLLFCFFTVRRDRYRVGLGNENLYAGSFGCWIWLFLGFQILMPFIMIKIAPSYTLLGSGIAFLLSLVCVAWPVYKGESWRKTCYAIGWHKGDGLLVESFYGFLAYFMTMPIIIVALIFTLFMFSPIVGGSFSGILFVLKKLGTPEGGAILAAAHPIVSIALQADFQTACMILFLACVCAPLVEETVFRGILYHHLRETTSPLWERKSVMKAAFYSVAISTTINAFVFAAIHPQGLQGIPVLMAGAIGMTMARQFRGSLISPIVMHAIMNFVTLGTVMFLYR